MKIKIEHLLMFLAVVCVGSVATRITGNNKHQLAARSEEASARMIASTAVPVVKQVVPLKNQPVANNPNPHRATTLGKHRQREVMLSYYKTLQGLPHMELERLKWLEKMEEGPFSEAELAEIAMTELVNNAPQADLSFGDNQRRRIATGIAFSMYLDYCTQFEACQQNAITALIQTHDHILRSEMIQELRDRYPESWQQEILTQQFQRYDLGPSNDQASYTPPSSTEF